MYSAGGAAGFQVLVVERLGRTYWALVEDVGGVDRVEEGDSLDAGFGVEDADGRLGLGLGCCPLLMMVIPEPELEDEVDSFLALELKKGGFTGTALAPDGVADLEDLDELSLIHI